MEVLLEGAAAVTLAVFYFHYLTAPFQMSRDVARQVDIAATDDDGRGPSREEAL